MRKTGRQGGRGEKSIETTKSQQKYDDSIKPLLSENVVFSCYCFEAAICLEIRSNVELSVVSNNS